MNDFDPRPVNPQLPPSHLPAVPPASNMAMGTPLPAAPWAEPVEPKSGFNFLAFLHSFRRRWVLGVGVGCLIASTLAAMLYAFVPIKTEAMVQMRVRRKTEAMIKDRNQRQEHPQAFEIEKQTQASLLRSPFVIAAALRKHGISQLPLVRDKRWIGKRENPVAWLERQIKVEFAEGSELMTMSMSAPDHQKDQLIKVLNAVKDAYMREIVFAEQNAQREKLEKLREESKLLTRKMTDQLNTISDLSRTYGDTSSETVKHQVKIGFSRLATLDREKALLDQQWYELQDSLIAVQQRLNSNYAFKPKAFEEEEVLMTSYPKYAMLVSLKTELEAQMSMSGGTGGIGASAQAQSQLATINQQMEQIRYERKDEVAERLRMLNNNDERMLQQESELLQARRQMLAQRREAVHAEHEKLTNELRRMGVFNSELQVLQVEMESDEQLAHSINEEIQSVELEMNSKPKIDVLFEAFIPDTEGNWLMKYMQIIATWCLAMAGSVLGITMWDMQHQRVNTPQEVIDSGDVRVIGSLPTLNGRRHRRNLDVTLTRSIDSIRTALLYAKKDAPYEVVMVTSALGQEGKTTVASQLAVSFARSGRRTLLIDADIRNPQQHTFLGMQMEKGLSELLRSEATLEDVLKPTRAEGLWAMHAGHRDANTEQYLASAVVSKLFSELRSRFDLIVVDTGPAMTAPDAMLIGQQADAAIVSVRRDVSRLPKVTEAIDRLRSVGIQIAGVVLNGAGVDVRDNEQIAITPSNDPQLEKV